MRRWQLVAYALLLTHFLTFAQEKQSFLNKTLDSLITADLPSVAPGGIVLVAQKGNVVYKKSFGTANLSTKTPVNVDMIFRIGSITKQFTAIAILQLEEQGKLSLQDSIQVHVKDFPSKGMPITIANLLSHTSGIINYFEIKNPHPAKIRKVYTPAQGVDLFKDEPLKFKPGTQFEYSNSNYYLLGYIIELVTGATYETHIQQHILDQADLKHTYFVKPANKIVNVSPGYSNFGKKWEKAELQRGDVTYAAGMLMSTADDLFKWHQTLQQNKLIKAETFKRATTPFTFPDGSLSTYGYGWFVKNIDGSRTIEHGGSTDGYNTDEIYLPEEGIFVATLFNGYKTDMKWTILSNDIARVAAGKPLRTDIKVGEDKLKSYTGLYSYNTEYGMIVTYKDNRLFIKATNPKSRLPLVAMHPENENKFYIKEAPLKFEFVFDEPSKQFKLQCLTPQGKIEEYRKSIN